LTGVVKFSSFTISIYATQKHLFSPKTRRFDPFSTTRKSRRLYCLIKVKLNTNLMKQQEGAPTCLRLSLKGPMNLKTFGVTDMSNCQNVSRIFHLPIGLFCLFVLFDLFCVIVSHCVTLCHVCHIHECHIHECHTCDISNKYLCHVSFVIK
jgi:hypothetical protein